eukprot:NODE_11197_length_1302_cov_2.802553.p1 GENE.NODE_11197_length_1302_cov_2.802553~~NODE_11197_length_1302_cov_2.802553.p1  ORF type:complete len:269 (-),score=56.63 NODE_11197_length_1302_cov_2.802553:413-1219(-)
MPAEDSQKKQKYLTFIPECDGIHQRFDLMVVGHCAAQFSNLIASSGIVAPHPFSAVDDKDSPVHGDTVVRRRSTSELACGFSASATLFCDIDESLARVRIYAMEKFSDSLPNIGERVVALHTCVVFLFWQVDPGKIPNAFTNMTPTEAALTDFRDRLLEIMFMPAWYRPFVTILAFDVNTDQEALLSEFISQPLSKTLGLSMTVGPDPSLQSVVGIVTDLCTNMVAWQQKAALLPLPPLEKSTELLLQDGAAKARHQGRCKSQCCTVM